MQPVPNQPTQYNPNIGYTPSAPVQPAPQYNPNIAPPQPLPTVNQHYHQPLAHKQGLPQNSEKGAFANIGIVTVLISILLMGSGFGIGWFTNDVFDSPGSVDDALSGKWYTQNGESSLWLKSDGTIWNWEEVRFQCADGSGNIPIDYVNDGDGDCDDGSDEGVESLPDFSYDWTEDSWFGQTKGFKVDTQWYVSKDDKFCQHMAAQSNITDYSVTLCTNYKITGKVLWIANDDGDSQTECQPFLSMDRNNGPQTAGGNSGWDEDENTNQEWESQWDYGFSDYLTLKPSWCDEIDFR